MLCLTILRVNKSYFNTVNFLPLFAITFELKETPTFGFHRCTHVDDSLHCKINMKIICHIEVVNQKILENSEYFQIFCFMTIFTNTNLTIFSVCTDHQYVFHDGSQMLIFILVKKYF